MNNFAESLSQYSKHSEDINGHVTEIETQKSKISGIYSQKKDSEKFGKTQQKKLPDLNMAHHERGGASKSKNIGLSSDSEENNF